MARNTRGTKQDRRNGAPAPARGGTARQVDEAVPEGYDELSFGRVRGWFVFEAGNMIDGIMRDHFDKQGRYGMDRVYKIEVGKFRPRIADGETGEVVVANTGDLIGIDEKGFLRRLGDVPKGTAVYIKCLGKSEPSDEFPQGAYQFKLGVAKGVELRRTDRTGTRRGREPGEEDDKPLPF